MQLIDKQKEQMIPMNARLRRSISYGVWLFSWLPHKKGSYCQQRFRESRSGYMNKSPYLLKSFEFDGPAWVSDRKCSLWILATGHRLACYAQCSLRYSACSFGMFYNNDYLVTRSSYRTSSNPQNDEVWMVDGKNGWTLNSFWLIHRCHSRFPAEKKTFWDISISSQQPCSSYLNISAIKSCAQFCSFRSAKCPMLSAQVDRIHKRASRDMCFDFHHLH